MTIMSTSCDKALRILKRYDIRKRGILDSSISRNNL